MKCKVCGAESGKYPLCRVCNIRKEQGQIIKCSLCNEWHEVNAPCPAATRAGDSSDEFLYEAKRRLITQSETPFFQAIRSAVPADHHVFPQINLAAFVVRTDDAPYRNELFRNIDFLITDENFAPKIAVEINDMTHMNSDRQKRDQKVHDILEECGIPLLKLWTSYGVNPTYIQNKINELLTTSTARTHHFRSEPDPVPPQTTPQSNPGYSRDPSRRKKQGCYIATCVYGSYDCPSVWVLRRYRDEHLAPHWYGRLFIRLYYAISPTLVKWFGRRKRFHRFFRKKLDRMVNRLQKQGVADTPYRDEPGVQNAPRLPNELGFRMNP